MRKVPPSASTCSLLSPGLPGSAPCCSVREHSASVSQCLQRPRVPAEGPGSGVRTSGSASYQRSPLGLSEESEVRASILQAALCPSVGDSDVLVACVAVIVSAQKGLGDRLGPTLSFSCGV